MSAHELLQTALGSDDTLEDVCHALRDRTAQFWDLGDSVVVTQVSERDGGRDLHVWLAAGKLDTLRRWAPALDDIAREWQCARITIDGRKGWARVLAGYEPSDVGLTKEVA